MNNGMKPRTSGRGDVTRETKVCETCGETFERKSRTSHEEFAERHFCSHACRPGPKPKPRAAARTCKLPGCDAVFFPRVDGAGVDYCCERHGKDAANAAERARKARVRSSVPARVSACACGCGRTFEAGRYSGRKKYFDDACRDRANTRAHSAAAERERGEKRPLPPREVTRKPRRPLGRTGWGSEARLPVGSGRVDWAVRVLGPDGPVFPERLLKPDSELWIFGGLSLTEAELIERAERAERRRAEKRKAA